ncbi:MAG: UDP-4-amino-4,6-dideoxy-N-acetyl-beta-L-altrosamine transaminase [Gemmatimonadales bacterium]
MTYLPYGRQTIAESDVRALCAAARADFLTQGPGVAAFEAALAKATGARFAVVLNSGTAALHAAYAAAGLGPDGVLLTTAMTFAGTSNAALYLGASVRFADVSPGTALLDPDALPDDSRVRVLAPVHFAGQVADMERLATIAGERGWTIVEDACHALGAEYQTADGQWHAVGACRHSAMCCFSFHAVKHITTGEGGAVTTNDESCYHAMLRFRTHGITRDPAELTRDEGPWYYEQQELGYNYRITDLQCALGLSQLKRLGTFVERRRALAARYDAAFAALPEVRPLTVPPHSRGSYHLYVVRVPAQLRRALFEELRALGIGVNVHYLPVYRHPYYQRHGFAGVHLAQAEQYYAETITLPLFPTMADTDVDRVVQAFVLAFERVTATTSA